MSPQAQVNPEYTASAALSAVDLAKTVSALPLAELATFQETLLAHLIQKTPGVMGGSSLCSQDAHFGLDLGVLNATGSKF